MRHVVMSVYDLKAKVFFPPFFVPAAAVGVRAFRDCANDTEHAFSKNPADYSLFELGVFDDENGSFACGATPVAHGLAAAYVRDSVVEPVKAGGTL